MGNGQMTYTSSDISFFAAPSSVHHLKLVGLPIGIKPIYVAQTWAWHSRRVIVHTGKLIALCVGGPWHVTFDPSHILLWVWHEVNGYAVSVNQSDYHCWSSRAKRKASTTWSRCCVEDVLTRPYRK